MIVERIPEKDELTSPEMARYFSEMAKRYMKIPCRRVIYKVKAKGIKKGFALDIGTGPAVFPIAIIKEFPDIKFLAVDTSYAMLEVAKENACEAGITKKIYFHQATGYHLPLKNRSIDLVTCINTLHHLDDPLKLFNEIKRVLAPNGHLILVDFHRDISWPLAKLLNILWHIFFRDKKAKRGFIESFLSSYTVNECKDFLEKSELEGWKIYTKAYEMWVEC